MKRSKWRMLIAIMCMLVLALPFLGLPGGAPGAEAQTGGTCTDSDGGLNYEVAGYVQGVFANGWPYNMPDACETGDKEGFVREWQCNGIYPWPRLYECPNGCANGACVPETCTDADGDGYAVEGGGCGAIDCDDTDAAVNPGAAEVCDNGIDDDCNGLIDADDPECLVCTDLDEDGYAVEGGDCGAVDCDDTDPQVNPGAVEVCDNGIDDNCNGLIDADDPACLVCTDLDEDGYAIDGGACGPVDCDDTNPQVHPGAVEVCDNGIDDDCDSLIDADDPACTVGANPNILVVGWDGLQKDHFWQCYNAQLPECPNGLPNLQALSGGVIHNNTISNGTTETKPGWVQIFSGYNVETVGVLSNYTFQPMPEGYSVFEKIEDHFGADNVVTMFISAKGFQTGGDCNNGEPWCLTKTHIDYFELDRIWNESIANRALQLLETHQNDLFFALFLFGDPDRTGHLQGENSTAYGEMIVEDDYWLGEIMAKLQALGIDDQTLVYVVTDHGFDEGGTSHANAPYGIFASNDPLVVRGGNRKDFAPTFLERYGISLGPIGSAPAVDGHSLYSIPFPCTPEGEAYIDYPGAPACCDGLTLIDLDRKLDSGWCMSPLGGTGDTSGHCTACGNGVCEAPEHRCNCPQDCP
jgi:hypothetical protein